MKNGKLLLLLLTPLVLLACRPIEDVPLTSIEKDITFENGWEGLTESIDGPNTVRQVSDAIAEGGVWSTYHEINYGARTYRSESKDLDRGPVQGEEWYGISIYLPENYTADSLPEIVMQWHATPDTFELPRSPALALITRDGMWEVTYRSDPHRFSLGGSTPLTGNDKSVVIGSHLDDLENWVDWVFRVRWDYSGNGLLQVWKNGELVLDQDPVAIGYNDRRGCWVKFGLYKWDWKKDSTDVVSRAIYHDNYWRASEKP